MWFNAVYLLLIVAASPLLLFRSLRHGKYRQGWQAKLLGRTGLPPSDRPRIWLHAVSVGEVSLLRRLVTRLEREYPGHPCVISTTTVTGYELACKHFGSQRVFYCPLDFSWAVRCAIAEIQPAMLVLAELEVWPNLIAGASRQNVPVVVINGRLSESSYRGYQKLGHLVRNTFSRLSLVACQDETYAQRFIDVGVPAEAVQVTGSIKFDDAPTDRQTPQAMACADRAGLRPWHRVWIAGSTQAGEETVVLNSYQQLRERFPNLRLLIVPRHPQRFDACAAEIESQGFHCIRRSTLPDDFAAEPLSADSVFLVDTIGELRDWWATADIAFVGGSLGSRGGQNMLEPAGYGAAVCFGPNTRNFRDIVSHLLAADAAVVVDDGEALTAFVERCLSDVPAAEQLGIAAQAVVQQHRGATEKTLRLIAPLLSGGQQRVAA
ncbi:3-deoxy-D-manno-octulosonic acid transferase [Roseimaritima ulvae]|uniref:3-deoxy-D-manno-octulosonic acid transferase n=1 Tax=Roseimaritima ulvae TaxID=980254 RepID=A0A5B9QX77_9BACT|nr:3-deoxy-D-manno-octulosonic acid transferase [Roseimaritima ulvae]QEG41726.1 3-deoxy-D-manno-octulosonic acid transferase [Roseimaritima ulvae]